LARPDLHLNGVAGSHLQGDPTQAGAHRFRQGVGTGAVAINQDGEIVLIELKVSENFGVTDLHALAYAGAYASRYPVDLAQNSPGRFKASR
jgi:hypothetical protein